MKTFREFLEEKEYKQNIDEGRLLNLAAGGLLGLGALTGIGCGDSELKSSKTQNPSISQSYQDEISMTAIDFVKYANKEQLTALLPFTQGNIFNSVDFTPISNALIETLNSLPNYYITFLDFDKQFMFLVKNHFTDSGLDFDEHKEAYQNVKKKLSEKSEHIKNFYNNPINKGEILKAIKRIKEKEFKKNYSEKKEWELCNLYFGSDFIERTDKKGYILTDSFLKNNIPDEICLSKFLSGYELSELSKLSKSLKKKAKHNPFLAKMLKNVKDYPTSQTEKDFKIKLLYFGINIDDKQNIDEGRLLNLAAGGLLGLSALTGIGCGDSELKSSKWTSPDAARFIDNQSSSWTSPNAAKFLGIKSDKSIKELENGYYLVTVKIPENKLSWKTSGDSIIKARKNAQSELIKYLYPGGKEKKVSFTGTETIEKKNGFIVFKMKPTLD